MVHQSTFQTMDKLCATQWFDLQAAIIELAEPWRPYGGLLA